MPSLTPTLLADDTGKFIGGLVFALIWGISALASVIKKANVESNRKAAMRPIAKNPQPPKVPSGRAPAKSVFTPPPFRNPNNVMTQAAKLMQVASRPAVARPPLPPRVVQPAPPPLSPPATPAVSRASAEVRPVKASATPGATRPGGANAATIRRWLQPETVRRQFILTELFQPPLALREKRSNSDRS